MVGKLERLPETAVGDALVQQLASALIISFLAYHDQFGSMLGKLDLILAEACDGHRDTVIVLVDLLDVIGRPVWTRAAVEHVEKPVETDGGPIEGIKGSHSHILLEATWVQGRRPVRRRHFLPSLMALAEIELGGAPNEFKSISNFF
ncbi:hypothetical protein X736_05120 [Mesorhizobium sp. L2C089B000]|nr:hypothetical protein X736_05120 [Mesorhizobium sp. L2C089B000]